MRDIWYIKDNKRTKEINKKEIVDNQFRKNLRKGGTDRQKDKNLSTRVSKSEKYKDLENPVSVWSYDEKV